MKLDIPKIDFNKSDINRKVTIPTKMTQKLAYFIGVHVGDGCLNAYKRKTCNTIDYNVEYYGHEIDEAEFHKDYIAPLIKDLFNIKVWVYAGNKTTIRTSFRSKAVFYFLNRVIGLPAGSKRDMNVPSLIKSSNFRIKKAFLKGLTDTDGCISFKKRYKRRNYYPSIGINSQSKSLIIFVKFILDNLKINSCVCYNLRNYRNGKVNFEHQIDISGRKNLDIWMDKIGFNSSKHLTKYDVWKKFGFCPPNTNIIERRKILKGVVDINSYYGPVAQPG